MAVDKQLASLAKLMDKLTKSMRKSDKAIMSLAARKRTPVKKYRQPSKAATERADKNFEKVIALLETGSNSHRKRRLKAVIKIEIG